MAAVTRVAAHPCTPAGYEYVAGVTNVTQDVTAGDLLVLGATGWAKSDQTNPGNKHGFAAKAYKSGQKNCSILTAGDIPYYFYVDDEGDQTALPCTERLMTERIAARVKSEHLIPLLSIKGRPEVRLGGFTALSGGPLAGRWPEPTGAVFPTKPEPVAEEEESEGEEGEEGASEDGESTDGESGDGDSGDSGLDDLMSSLDDTPSEEAPAEESSGEEAPAEESGEGEMDPELAELLKGL